MPPMKKRAYKKRAMKRHPISRGLSGVPDVASMTEMISLNTSGQGRYNVNTPYSLYNVSLGLTSRGALVAQAYQEYRIRRVTLVWKALQDTFTPQIGVSAGGALSVPQLYFLVDKKMVIPLAFDEVTLQQCGSVPRRFDDKNVKAHYAPAVLQSAITDPGSLTTALAASNISPWIPTNKTPSDNTTNVSDVDHTGIAWYVRQAGVTVAGGGSNQGVTYDVDILLDIEFRKPRITRTQSPGVDATPVFA